jgi:diguanylate cyclase (GGDEF)-like protein
MLIGPVLIIVLILAIEAFLTFAVKDPSLRMASLDILPVVINLLASIALFWAAYESKRISRRLGFAWLLMAIGQLIYTLGDLSWLLLEVILEEPPYPSFADLFFVAYYPIFFIGTVLLSLENHVITQKFKNTLDMAIIISGAFLFYWFILLQPLAAANLNEPWFTRALAAAYPVGNILLLAAILWLLNSNPNRYAKTQVITLLLGILVMIITDTIFSYQSLRGTYESGTILDAGWTLSYTLTGLAGLQQIYAARNRKNLTSPDTLKGERDSFRKNALAFSPYFWIIMAYLILYFGNRPANSKNFMSLYIWVGSIIGLVIIRQAWAFFEIRHLNKKLRNLLSQVEQQTRELVTINQELESEIQLRVRVEEQLSFDALHDSLTNLPNRALFFQRLENALDDIRKHPDKKYSVLFMDIDQFKVINDSLGHGMGDQLLITIAQRLARTLRETDTVARLGGDEFVFLLENTSNEHIIDFIVNRINEEVHKVIMLE